MLKPLYFILSEYDGEVTQSWSEDRWEADDLFDAQVALGAVTVELYVDDVYGYSSHYHRIYYKHPARRTRK